VAHTVGKRRGIARCADDNRELRLLLIRGVKRWFRRRVNPLTDVVDDAYDGLPGY